MGIHQALIGGYSLVEYDWEVSSLFTGTGNFTIPSSSLAANDLIVFILGEDIGGPFLRNPSITTTTLLEDDINSIETYVQYGVVPTTPSNITGDMEGDYGVIIGFRRSGSTSSYNLSVEATNTTSTSPSHNNTAVSFSKNDLALLLAFVDDDATPMTPPTDSTKIAEDQEAGDGSVGAAYKQIDISANYSWGSWTTTGTDNTLAYVIKIEEA